MKSYYAYIAYASVETILNLGQNKMVIGYLIAKYHYVSNSYKRRVV